MELRNLGKSGLRVPVVGLGCNNFGSRIDLDATRAVIGRALDLGVNFLDTADIYGNPKGASEDFIGRVLGEERRNVLIATKFANPMDEAGRLKGASRRYIVQAVEASLKRLRTDYIDLYQMHVPDPLTPIEETLSALDDLVRNGLVRYVGSSNLAAWQVVDAAWTARNLGTQGFIAAQNEFSLVHREPEQELLPALEAHGIGLLPYFPLAGGLLSGKYHQGEPLPAGTRFANAARYGERYMTEANWRIVEELRGFVQARDRSLLDLAFAWLLAHKPVASVIAGATRPEQVEQNTRAAAWVLTPEELAEVNRIATA
jgi:aryl-alcohol dehydrogenase-like predicted oxidoreductase